MTTKEKTAALWKKLANEKNIKYYDVAAYALIRAINSKSNEKLEVARALLLKAFTPITNENKLNNGAVPFQRLQWSLNWANWSVLLEELSPEEKKTFLSLVEQLRKEEWSDPEFCYILTRTDLPKVHQLVQTAHVTLQAGHFLGKKNYDVRNLHFCVLDGGTENDLREALRAKNLGLAFCFTEPDADKLWGGNPRGELTAIALHPMRRSAAQRKGIFSEKKLLEM